MNDPIEERVINIIAKQVGADPAAITLDATLEVLGIASCQGVEMTFAIEDSFDINVPMGACDLKVATVGDMVDAVRAILWFSLTLRSAMKDVAHRPLPSRARPSCRTARRDDEDRWLYAESTEDTYT